MSLPTDPFVTAVYEMVGGGPLALLVMAMSGEPWDPASWSTRSVRGLHLPRRVRLPGAFTAYVWVLSNAAISLVATYAYASPVVALLIGAPVLGESLTAAAVVSTSAVALLGVTAVVRSGTRR